MATTFGSGYSPIAPGTAGALVGVLLIYIFQDVPFSLGHGWQTEIPFIIAIIAFLLIGVKASNEMEKEWGHDAQKIVIDELVGVWIAMLFVPVNLTTLALAFVLFRFFDIAKPLGIRKMEQLPSGWGVMMDDVLAGVYSLIVLQTIRFFFPAIG